MHRWIRHLLGAGALCLLLVSRHGGAGAAEAIVGTATAREALPREAIRMEIVEGIADTRNWKFKPPAASERYTKPAFAFVGLPKRYSPRGIVAERKYPLLVRTTGRLELAAGEYRILLRAKGAARLYCDGQLLLETHFRVANVTGDEPVPELPGVDEPGLRPAPPGHEDVLATRKLDGKSHEFRLEAIVGDQKLRPDIGELCVAIAAEGEPLRLLAPASSGRVLLNDDDWQKFAAAGLKRLKLRDAETRREASAEEDKYWARRHELARREWEQLPELVIPRPSGDAPINNAIDQFVAMGVAPAPSEVIEDYKFLRRVTLDLVGVIPTRAEIEAFLSDAREDRRARVIDRLLDDPRWADAWVGYWQDVLAENPGLVRPELNNTGPFREWIYESLCDNKPLDRFATELIMMEGGPYSGTPGGFALATQNDAPLAEKAHTVSTAFLAVELKCARCHDAPFQPYTQRDTFSLAAMLSRGPLSVPATSTLPHAGGRQPAVEVSLQPGDQVAAAWPLAAIASADVPKELVRKANDTREQLALLVTSPRNERFPRVIMNRVWKRYFGWGLVEPVDDWTDPRVANAELLEYLTREFVTHGYDLKHITRLITNSAAYQSETVSVRRRMSAEQLVDSLFAAVDRTFGCEALDFDPEGRRPAETFWNLGVPRRTWQLASLSNERDRPGLSLPVAQSLIDLAAAFGWRETRPNPVTDRDESANVMQPLALANGTATHRAARLTDDSAITRLCLEDRPLEELIGDVYLQILSRPPRPQELHWFGELLAPGYAERRVNTESTVVARSHPTTVSWSNHLSPEATQIKLDAERAARVGEPATPRLTVEWRERMEDMVWALVNSPEFVFIP